MRFYLRNYLLLDKDVHTSIMVGKSKYKMIITFEFRNILTSTTPSSLSGRNRLLGGGKANVHIGLLICHFINPFYQNREIS